MTVLLAFAGGWAAACGVLLSIAVTMAQEPPSPIHHAPKRPTFQWATDGFCKPFSNDCRIAAMGGTR